MDHISTYYARQPISDASQQIVGYEFFWRDDCGAKGDFDPRTATASILVGLLNQAGLHNSAADTLLFINIDNSILESHILHSLPAERFVFELQESSHITSKERELIQELRVKGYKFAIDNASTNNDFLDRFALVFELIEYVKFDTTATDLSALAQMLPKLKGKKLIAQKVEIPEVYEAYKELGFELFQGYYFAKLHLIQHNRVDPKHLGVIKIYNMLISKTPIEQIASEFEKHNELALQFLQYVNSINAKNGSRNSSMESILKQVGSKQLEQWILMIIYSKTARNIETKKSPHSLMAEQRIDIMNKIIETINPLEKEKMCEQARLCALISLMESVLNVPMAMLLKHIHVKESIEDALLAHAGKLGRIFALTLSVESGDYASAQVLLRALKLDKYLLEELDALRKI